MKNNLLLAIAASSLFACILVPDLRKHFGVVVPSVMQSVIILIGNPKNDKNYDEQVDRKRKRH